ncbi:hypothetical protein QBZ16_001146 [Prototheca wickerhamii]|uniref:ferroxidase n=1 Tax=Prototheca wickerhamii TaxID=3111 RepID=A0AAD9MG75_PROWI|nr:hypothetical protein QBZ16_001146 [Prototheca wickerhamii]
MMKSYDTHVEDKEFHKEADKILEALQDQLDVYLEDNGIEGEVEYSQGVLTLDLGSRGTYVLNKQAPNHQIWSSSPVRRGGSGHSYGPVRYDFREGRWIYLRDAHVLVSRLSQELSNLTGVPCDLHAGDES